MALAAPGTLAPSLPGQWGVRSEASPCLPLGSSRGWQPCHPDDMPPTGSPSRGQEPGMLLSLALLVSCVRPGGHLMGMQSVSRAQWGAEALGPCGEVFWAGCPWWLEHCSQEPLCPPSWG